MKYSIGIDLGTTFSAAASVDETGRPGILPNSEGKPITPSVIYFGKGEPIVGDEAKEMQALGETNIASFFKRNMGNPGFILELNNRKYTPTDLSAILLKKLKADAGAALEETVTHAVITVPAYFNNFQREATIKAGEMAGLKVLRIINEPTAAALAYGVKRIPSDQTFLVYDLGGGTFDVSIIHITQNLIKVIATDGDHELGGKDWDDRIAAYLGQQFYQEYSLDPLDDTEAFMDILTRAEDAKKQLSAREKVRISIVHKGEKGAYQLTRSQFEEITKDLVERTRNFTQQVLKDAGMAWTDLGGVLLVGGSTRMPMVKDYVEQMSSKKPMTGVNVDEAVALGAAIQAHMDMEEIGLAPPILTLPGKKKTQDVMSHSLGMVSENEDRSRYINSIIIPKNKPIPCSESRPFQLRTLPNRSNSLEVYMLQGESPDPAKCILLGKYVFGDVTYVNGGTAIIDIEYAYDRNGVVTVTATERSTGKILSMQIEPLPDDMEWLAKPPQEKEEEEILDLSSFTLVLTPPGFDDIGKVLGTLGLTFQDYESPESLSSCDILFLNCGTSNCPDTNSLKSFVDKGGCLYASDLTYSIVEGAFPGFINFEGPIGKTGHQTAAVVDPELRDAIGNTIEVTFDMGSWAAIDTVESSVTVIMRSKDTGKPLMVVFNYGEGTVFYTCFHNHTQASQTEQFLLQILVLKQISAVSGVSISKIARVITETQMKTLGEKGLNKNLLKLFPSKKSEN